MHKNGWLTKTCGKFGDKIKMNVLISKRVWKILPFIIMLGLIGVILFGLYHDADIRYALFRRKMRRI